jgi:hypothetical protein
MEPMRIDISRYQPCAQRRWNSCIPAAIENVLVFFGEKHWTQERIWQAWHRWYNQTRASPDWDGRLPLDLKSPSEFLRETELGERFSFEFTPCVSADQALEVIALRLSSPEPVPTIVSTAVPQGGAHMLVVVGSCTDGIVVHDPRGLDFQTVPIEAFRSLIGAEPHLLLIDHR